MLYPNGNQESLQEPFRPAQGQASLKESGSEPLLRLRMPRRPIPQGRSACLFYARRSESQASDAAGLRSPDPRQRPKIVRTPAPRLSCTGQARPGVARERRLSPSAPAQDLPIGPLATPAGAGGLTSRGGCSLAVTGAPHAAVTLGNWGTSWLRSGLSARLALAARASSRGAARGGWGKPRGRARLPRVALRGLGV